MHSLQPLRNTWLIAIMLLAAGLIPTQPARAGFLDPGAFSSLGAFSTQTGDYVINTQVGQVPTMQLPDGTIIQGVVANGQLAVFTFSSVNITSGMYFGVYGGPPNQFAPTNTLSYGFALLSQGSLTIAPGAQIAAYATNFSITVPSAQLAPGGAQGGYGGGLQFPVQNGAGPGGGGSGSQAGAGGGGNGGAGGAGGLSGNHPGAGGSSGGGVGSGGGGADGGLNGGGNGGSGGGFVDLGALGPVVIGGTVDVHGSNATNGNGGGGGGSGGTILISGSSVSLTGSLLANGGNGGNAFSNGAGVTYSAGGGGGGGVISIDAGSGFLNSGTIDVDGGQGGISLSSVPTNPGFAGGAGVVNIFEVVPEPASVVLLGAGAVLVGLARLRARRTAPIS
jgi:hypothetical protein